MRATGASLRCVCLSPHFSDSSQPVISYPFRAYVCQLQGCAIACPSVVPCGLCRASGSPVAAVLGKCLKPLEALWRRCMRTYVRARCRTYVRTYVRACACENVRSFKGSFFHARPPLCPLLLPSRPATSWSYSSSLFLAYVRVWIHCFRLKCLGPPDVSCPKGPQAVGQVGPRRAPCRSSPPS